MAATETAVYKDYHHLTFLPNRGITWTDDICKVITLPIMLQWFKETLKEKVKHKLTSLWNAVVISFSSISQIDLMCSFSSC